VADEGQGAIRPCGSSWSGPFSVPDAEAADSEYDACAVILRATRGRPFDGPRVTLLAAWRARTYCVEGPDALRRDSEILRLSSDRRDRVGILALAERSAGPQAKEER
jgi:hypothetical protein